MDYSRLNALSEMGVIKDYSLIHTKTVMIIGIGGIGSVAAEMLCRCGIGKLILIDYDKVEAANMNRMFYLPTHIGLHKTEAAQKSLNLINPNVKIECECYNVTTVENYNKLLNKISKGGINGKQVDLLLCCVDNYIARISINNACLTAKQIWFESGVSENAMNGHIQFMIPGELPCYQCAQPMIVALNEDESKIKRDKACTASLPTTMSIIAGLLSQNALMYLLQFGQIQNMVVYTGTTSSFVNLQMKPSGDCLNEQCKILQKSAKLAVPINVVKENKKLVISSEFEGFSVVSEGDSNNTNTVSVPPHVLGESLKEEIDDLRDELSKL